MGSGKSSLWRALAVLSAAMLVPIIPFAVIGELPGERWLEDSGGNSLGFGALGAGLLALDVLLPIPSSIVGAMLGGRLGFVAGFGWAFLGLCTGQVTGYALGRLLPARWASELAEVPSIALVFLSRPVPVLAEAVSIAAGVERMPFLQFMAAGAAGNACYAAAMAGDGAALFPQGLLGPGLILPMLLPVFAYLAWRWRAKRYSR
jgi:3-dehydroquinate synthase